MTFLPLDHAIFGNGYGMASPYFDGVFYWLDGELYHWSGWSGAQLASYQWTHPRSGERRTLSGVEFRPFHSERRWGRVRVSWAAVSKPCGLDEQNEWLRALRAHLGEGLHLTGFQPPAQAMETRQGEDAGQASSDRMTARSQRDAPKTSQ